MRYVQTPQSRWLRKPLAVVALIALAPLMLAVAVRAAVETANVVVTAIGPVVPYAVVIVMLALAYRLVLGRRM